MKRLILALFVISIVGALEAHSQGGSPCSCNDARDLLNRLNEASAAIAEYRNQIEIIRSQEKAEGKRITVTVKRYDEIMQPKIQEAINHVTDPGAHHGTAKTDERTCQTTFSAPTECLRKVLDVHEGVHRTACPMRNSVTAQVYMTDLAQEEINSYNSEINYILSLMGDMPKLCQPQMWFGTIKTKRTGTVTERGRTTTVKETGDWILLLTQNAPDLLPGSISGLPPGAEAAMRQAMAKAQAKMAKSGVVLGVTKTYAFIERETKWKGGGTDCCSTDAGSSPDINMTEREAANGRDKGNATVIYAAGKLNINFSHPAINGLRQTSQDVITSSCPYDKDDAGEAEDVTLSLTIPKLETAATSRIVDGVEFLEGTKTITDGGYKLVYEWNLKRIAR